jgi:hypothetical protein
MGQYDSPAQALRYSFDVEVSHQTMGTSARSAFKGCAYHDVEDAHIATRRRATVKLSMTRYWRQHDS